MDWYAIQVLTGKEDEVATALKDCGKEVMLPIGRFSIAPAANSFRTGFPQVHRLHTLSSNMEAEPCGSVCEGMRYKL